jgi:hypothetical protein
VQDLSQKSFSFFNTRLEFIYVVIGRWPLLQLIISTKLLQQNIETPTGPLL